VTISRVTAPFGRRAAVVRAVERHGADVFSLHTIDVEGPRPVAGQFYMLQTAEGWGGGQDGRPYLPRALSFARAERCDGDLMLSFLLAEVGPGTARLAACEAGEQLLIAGPFGNGFDLDPERWPLLVAGGIGLAPIVALDDELRDLDGVRSTALVGMRDADRARAVDAYGLDHQLATEDGSAGHCGYVTELLARELDAGREATVYACGPPAMLEAVRALCAERGVPSQLAMESGMACGFGACYGCVVPTVDGYVRLCVDGPVLAGDRLETALVERAASS
jgi:dihydroorotate dehydrogenase electron transfer subunit